MRFSGGRADRKLREPDEPAGFGQPANWDADLAGLDALGGKTFDPEKLPADQRGQLEKFLTATFNTPGAPRVAGDADPAPQEETAW